MMKKQPNTRFLKSLARIIPHFPVILKTQADITQAEQSGDLSFGMYHSVDRPMLPKNIRNALSFMFIVFDKNGNEKNFFPHLDETSRPFSEERKLLQAETKEKAAQAMQVFKAKDPQVSPLLRYITADNYADLENQARAELISVLLHQWNESIVIDDQFLQSLDVFSSARQHPLKNLLFPDQKKLEAARQYIQTAVNNDMLLYHHSFACGSTLWRGIKTLRAEINKPEFKAMLAAGKWSPASFLIQNKVPAKSMFRVAARKTNLGGVLSYQINPGRLVLLSNRDSAIHADDLFNHLCCGSEYIMGILTLLVDQAHPGIRKLTANTGCPFSKDVNLPLY